MNMVKWVVAGLIGGAIGAAVWAAVASMTGFQVGIIAWGIGALVGLCVRKAADDEADVLSGVVAAVIAVASIVGGKYVMLFTMIQKLEVIEVSPDPVEDWEACIAVMASDRASEQERKGKKLEWPEGVAPYSGYTQTDYPPDVWDEASRAWYALSDAGRAEYAADVLIEVEPDAASVAWEVLPMSLFSVFSLIFLALGAATAFKIAGDFGA